MVKSNSLRADWARAKRNPDPAESVPGPATEGLARRSGKPRKATAEVSPQRRFTEEELVEHYRAQGLRLSTQTWELRDPATGKLVRTLPGRGHMSAEFYAWYERRMINEDPDDSQDHLFVRVGDDEWRTSFDFDERGWIVRLQVRQGAL